jgi:O-acetyl-ADP-ribose deacetylase (regulator of RNase III)
MNYWELSKDEEEKNRKLEDAIMEYTRDSSDEGLAVVGKALLDRIGENGEIAVPVVLPDGFSEAADDDEMDVINIDLRTIQDNDGNDWLPLFTNKGASAKGGETDLLAYSMKDIFQQIMTLDGISGAVIDPWTTPFQLPLDYIALLLNIVTEEDGGEINLVQGNIVDVDVQCIVNSANNTLLCGPDEDGVNAAIHKAAGPGLDAECRALRGCAVGEAKITDGYDLDAEYIIHTVGPIYNGKLKDSGELGACYESCMDLARQHGITSIAFPCISTGAFGYPMEEAADVALQTVLQWLGDNEDYDINVTFCVHDDDAYKLYKDALDQMFEETDGNEQ